MDINRVNITARLTKEPEVRTTGNGTKVLNIRVAVNDRRRNNQTGEWEDYPNFIDCTMFGDKADRIAPNLYKGQRVAIEGKLRWSQWERDGQKRSALDVVMDSIVFIERKDKASDKPAEPVEPMYEPKYVDFDIPF